MASADALISIDSEAAENPFVASKLVEYLPFRKPILGISPPGAARELLQSVGAFIAAPSDKKAVIEAVTSIVNFLYDHRSQDGSNPKIEKQNWKNFEKNSN